MDIVNFAGDVLGEPICAVVFGFDEYNFDESILYKFMFTQCFNGRNLMWTTWRPDAQAVLMDKKARASLKRYFDVMEDDKPAKFLIAKKLAANFSNND